MYRNTLAILALGTWISACTPEGGAKDSASDTAPQADNSFAAAESYKQKGKLMEAARIYETIARENPQDVEAEIEIAAIDRRMARPQEAVEVMRDALKRQPGNHRVMMHLAYALVDAKRFEEAVGIFDGLIAADPKNVQGYSGKGIAFDKSGNHLAAQDLYSQALKIDPDNLGAKNNLAMSLILNNQFAKAIELLESLSAKHNDNKTIRHNLALAYGLSGNREKAMAINSKDLTPEQARENERFYAHYASKRLNRSALRDSEHISVGFSETPEARKAVLSKPDKAEVKATIKELYPETDEKELHKDIALEQKMQAKAVEKPAQPEVQQAKPVEKPAQPEVQQVKPVEKPALREIQQSRPAQNKALPETAQAMPVEKPAQPELKPASNSTQLAKPPVMDMKPAAQAPAAAKLNPIKKAPAPKPAEPEGDEEDETDEAAEESKETTEFVPGQTVLPTSSDKPGDSLYPRGNRR